MYGCFIVHYFRPLEPNKIVEEAISKIGEIGYNLLWDNCEHFAAYCRYGIKWSEQVHVSILF